MSSTGEKELAALYAFVRNNFNTFANALKLYEIHKNEYATDMRKAYEESGGGESGPAAPVVTREGYKMLAEIHENQAQKAAAVLEELEALIEAVP